MNKKIPFAALSSAAVLASFVAVPLAPLANEVQTESNTSPENYTLSIMHTNDTHAKVETAPKRITAIKEIRAEKPEAVLIDAGDVFTGTLYFNEFQGKADLEFMNLAGYDVMTFGNHEFDLGSSAEGHKALADFIKGAQFPFVSANADFSADENLQGLFSDIVSSEPENGKIYNGIVKEVNGEKVGFFGLTTPETADLSSPDKVVFEDYIASAEKAVAAFEDMGVNKIVAVSHIGFDDNPEVDNDITLAEKVDGIDVIVGGHSHTQLNEPYIVNKGEDGAAKDPTVIVQASSQGDYLGTVDVEFDENGKITGQAGQLIKVADYEADPQALEILDKYKPQVDQVAQTEIGATTETVLENPRTNGDNTKPSVRKNETPLGNLITDGMLAKAKQIDSEVVLSMQNGGGIRASIDAGPITNGEVITVLPFGNTLSIMEVTGSELKQAFEISVGNYPLENGGFLHVSGAKVEFDSSKPKGERVVSISYEKVDGSYTEIQDNETYKIATNAFTAKGGDGYDVFAKAYEEGRVTDLGLSDWENLAQHLVSLGSITPEVEGRIMDVASMVKPFPFEDIDNTNWSYEHIYKLYQKDIIKGVSDTSFAPLRSVSRVEFAAMLGRTLKLTPTLSDAKAFTDVPEWAEKEVQALFEAGIIQGREQGVFDPDTQISREHMALMIVRAYEYKTGTDMKVENEKIYHDQNQISQPALEAVQKLSQLKIMEGRPNNEFAPQSPSTRAEAAKVVSLLSDKLQ